MYSEHMKNVKEHNIHIKPKSSKLSLFFRKIGNLTTTRGYIHFFSMIIIRFGQLGLNNLI